MDVDVDVCFVKVKFVTGETAFCWPQIRRHGTLTLPGHSPQEGSP